MTVRRRTLERSTKKGRFMPSESGPACASGYSIGKKWKHSRVRGRIGSQRTIAEIAKMTNQTVKEFREAIRSAGLEPLHEVIADGKIHRFATNDNRGDDAGWYIFYGDGIPAGSFGDWRTVDRVQGQTSMTRLSLPRQLAKGTRS